MPEPSHPTTQEIPMSSGLAISPGRGHAGLAAGRDSGLDAALERLAPGQRIDRPDTPDLHVTAVRRLPSVDARYVDFPVDLDLRLRRALERRGITQLYTHQ